MPSHASSRPHASLPLSPSHPNTASWPLADRTRFSALVALQSLLSRVPKDPINRTIRLGAQSQGSSFASSLPLPEKLERDLADFFAFLAAADTRRGCVAACALEEGGEERGPGVVFRVALGEGVPENVLAGLREVCERMRDAATLDLEESTARDYVWRKVLSLSHSRILLYLQQKFRPTASPSSSTSSPSLLSNLFSSSLTAKAPASENASKFLLRQIHDRIFAVLRSSSAAEPLELLLDTCHTARKSRDFKRYLHLINAKQQVVQIIEKLGRYKAATYALVGAARKYPELFKNVGVSAVPWRGVSGWEYPSDTQPGEELLRLSTELTGQSRTATTRMLISASELPEATLYTKFSNLLHTPPSIHPEIQLLCFYEEFYTTKKPGLIGTSDKSCYLCSLFCDLHGSVRISKSNRNLYPGWSVPSVPTKSEKECHRLDLVRKEMLELLEESCRASLTTNQPSPIVKVLASPLVSSPKSLGRGQPSPLFPPERKQSYDIHEKTHEASTSREKVHDTVTATPSVKAATPLSWIMEAELDLPRSVPLPPSAVPTPTPARTPSQSRKQRPNPNRILSVDEVAGGVSLSGLPTTPGGQYMTSPPELDTAVPPQRPTLAHRESSTDIAISDFLRHQSSTASLRSLHKLAARPTTGRVDKGKAPATASGSDVSWTSYPYPNPAIPESLPELKPERRYTVYLAKHYKQGFSVGDRVFSGTVSEVEVEMERRGSHVSPEKQMQRSSSDALRSRRSSPYPEKSPFPTPGGGAVGLGITTPPPPSLQAGPSTLGKMVQCHGFRMRSTCRRRKEGEVLVGRKVPERETGGLVVREVVRDGERCVLDCVFRDAVLRMEVWWDT